jgi:hypothetical protein
MDEEVRPVFSLDETVAFSLIEPLYDSIGHRGNLLSLSICSSLQVATSQMDVTLRTKPVRKRELSFYHRLFPKEIKIKIDGETVSTAWWACTFTK